MLSDNGRGNKEAGLREIGRSWTEVMAEISVGQSPMPLDQMRASHDGIRADPKTAMNWHLTATRLKRSITAPGQTESRRNAIRL